MLRCYSMSVNYKMKRIVIGYITGGGKKSVIKLKLLLKLFTITILIGSTLTGKG